MKNKDKPHLLAIDFESWIFSENINKQKLTLDELRRLDDGYSIKTLSYILEILKKYNQKVTFFLVFKLEEVYPGIIDRIKKDGHEVGWHSHTHAIIKNANILKNELELSRKLLKKYHVKGFQAPTVSFVKEGYKLLKRNGFIYSSSIYGNSQMIYEFDGVYEIPVSVSNKLHRPKKKEIVFPSDMKLWKLLKYGIPYGSSFFWSSLGKRYYRKILKNESQKNNICNLFIHDWQLVTPLSDYYKRDVGLFSDPLFSTFFLLYRKNVSKLFEYLLSNFSFQRFINYVEQKKRISL